MMSLNLAAALAWAEDVAPGAAGGAQQPSMFPTLLIFGGMFLFMYLVLFRPQQKKQREHQEMLSRLQKGDRIQTSGGLFGVVTGTEQDELTVEIAPQVRVKIGRGFVARIVKLGRNESALDKENRK